MSGLYAEPVCEIRKLFGVKMGSEEWRKKKRIRTILVRDWIL